MRQSAILMILSNKTALIYIDKLNFVIKDRYLFFVFKICFHQRNAHIDPLAKMGFTIINILGEYLNSTVEHNFGRKILFK